MKRFLSSALLALTIITAFCFGQVAPERALAHSSSSSSNNEQAVRQFIEELAAAFSNNDAAALDRLTAPDYTFVTPTGGIQDKTQRLAPIKSGDLKYESVKYEEVGVHVYGNMAVMTSRVVVKGRNKETDISGQFRSTLTMAKLKGRWRLVASQASPIKP